MKPTRMGQSGGIVKAESPVYASKVQLVCPECGKPTRVGHTFEEKNDKKVKLRVCKKCGKSFK
jgi:large subunit ribosomal protein L24